MLPTFNCLTNLSIGFTLSLAHEFMYSWITSEEDTFEAGKKHKISIPFCASQELKYSM